MTTGHSKIGGSSAKRWINCPGSVKLCASLPPKKVGDYALEGTAAHSFAEACLLHGYDKVATLNNSELIALGYLTKEETEWINDELKKYVKVYVDAVRASINAVPSGALFRVEESFDISNLHPDLYGTNDALVGEFSGILEVSDLKYGKGTIVEVKDNYQLMYYALGAIKKYFDDWGFSHVKMTIVQPRAHHEDGPIRSHIITIEELKAWGENVLKPAAMAVHEPNAPLKAGPWCQENFCDARAHCPAIIKEAANVAKMEFSEVTTAEDVCFPEPKALSPVDISKVLMFAQIMPSWVKEVEAYAKELLEQELDVPGFKLIAKKGNRRWINAAQVAKLLAVDHDENKLYEPRKFKSVAQMEKVTGKEALNGFWEKPDNGVKIVPDSHRSPSVKSSAALDFDKI